MNELNLSDCSCHVTNGEIKFILDEKTQERLLQNKDFVLDLVSKVGNSITLLSDEFKG